MIIAFWLLSSISGGAKAASTNGIVWCLPDRIKGGAKADSSMWTSRPLWCLLDSMHDRMFSEQPWLASIEILLGRYLTHGNGLHDGSEINAWSLIFLTWFLIRLRYALLNKLIQGIGTSCPPRTNNTSFCETISVQPYVRTTRNCTSRAEPNDTHAIYTVCNFFAEHRIPKKVHQSKVLSCFNMNTCTICIQCGTQFR